jgi:acyl carrier protein
MKNIPVTKGILKKYVIEHSFKDGSLVQNDTLLFQEGIFDSMGFALLIEFLEEQFSITTSDDDLVEANFESINAIADFIYRKKNGNIN